MGSNLERTVSTFTPSWAFMAYSRVNCTFYCEYQLHKFRTANLPNKRCSTCTFLFFLQNQRTVLY